MSEGVSVEASSSGQFGLGIKEPGHDHGDDQVPLGVRESELNNALEPQCLSVPRTAATCRGGRAYDVKSIVELLDGGAAA